MSVMTPKRLHLLLEVNPNQNITGLHYSPSSVDDLGIVVFGICEVVLTYDGAGWWNEDTNRQIAPEILHESRRLALVYAELRRVLALLRPDLPSEKVEALGKAGWLK